MKAGLSLRVGQSLTMTPALQQAIRMLQLSSQEMQQEIQQMLDSNMMLEGIEESPAEVAPEDRVDQADQPESSDAGSESTSDEIPDDLPVDAEWDDVYDGTTHRSTAADEALYEFRQANLHTKPSLREHLTWQAGLQPFDEHSAIIAANIVDAIDGRGYLPDWSHLVSRLRREGHRSDAIDAVLAQIQQFDPTGIGARDLGECLHLQLDQLELDLALRQCANRIVDGHLPALARNDLTAIARTLGQPLARVEAAAALIRTLNPSPGDAFADLERNYVAPEVFVAKREGRWLVSLNPDVAPRIRINDVYSGMIKQAGSRDDQQTMRQHLQEARYFINSLKSRNDTLLKVAEQIVKAQRGFLEYGEEAMKPLVLRDIADEIGVHESTVSRATSNKYMHTPRGLFELKFFFSSHVRTTEGGQCSATAIQAMIKRLIKEEAPNKPLSDSKLAKLLNEDGIEVARRTVAKYREALDLPPSHERKRAA